MKTLIGMLLSPIKWLLWKLKVPIGLVILVFAMIVFTDKNGQKGTSYAIVIGVILLAVMASVAFVWRAIHLSRWEAEPGFLYLIIGAVVVVSVISALIAFG